MKWTFTDPDTGNKLDYNGNTLPTEEELDQLFNKKQYPSLAQDQPVEAATPGPALDLQAMPSESIPSYLSRSPLLSSALRGAGIIGRNVLRGVGRGASLVGRAAGLAGQAQLAAIRNHPLSYFARTGLDAATALGTGVGGLERTAGEAIGDVAGTGYATAADWTRRNVIPSPLQIPAGRVKVRAPDGTIGTIPVEQAEQATQLGYTLAE